MKAVHTVRQAIAGAALLLGVAATSHAAVAVFEKTDSMAGATFQSKTYEFNIASPGAYFANLFDNAVATAFDFLQLSIFKTGGGTLGQVALGASNEATFSFVAAQAGSYTAQVNGLPGTVTLPTRTGGTVSVALGTYGVSVTPVPEPEVWAMMLVGAGLIGYQLRRKARAGGALKVA